MKILSSYAVTVALVCLVFSGCKKVTTICATAPAASAVNFKNLDQKIWKFDNTYE